MRAERIVIVVHPPACQPFVQRKGVDQRSKMAAPGRISGVNQAPPLAPNFLSAVHFFSANEGWTYPRDLIDNLTLQLRAYSRDFADSFDSTLKKRFAEGPGITSSVEVGSIQAAT
jgi:hypothetical protein